MNIQYRKGRVFQPIKIWSFIIVLSLLISSIASADSTTLTISDASATISEGVAGAISFTISRSGELNYDALVNYATQDGTAVAGTDFTAATGSLTIPSGSSTATVDVLVPAHSAPPGDKTFSLNLSNAIGLGPAPSLKELTVFSTGSGPSALASADFNGDGKIDIASANGTGNSISVLVNNTATGAAAPDFLPKQNFPTTFPRSIAAGDINGDGKPDLIVANLNSATATVFLNTTVPGSSTISFSAAQSFAAGDGAYAVVIGDVNGDGLPDIVVANNTANTVSVLINSTAPGASTASFRPQVSFAVGGGPRSVAITDFNGDGRLDLVVANNTDNSISVLINSGTPGASSPGFSAQKVFSVGGAPISVAVADVNVDGRPDLFVANNTSNSVSVLLNTTSPGAAAPTFSSHRDYATSMRPLSVVATDSNGDGLPDILVTGADQQLVSVIQNATAPGGAVPNFLAEIHFTANGTPFAVAALDINGDGQPDVVSANLSGDSLSVLMGSAALPVATFSAAPAQSFAVGNSPFSVAYGDLNGDGLLDLVVNNRTDNTISVLLNTTAAGSFTATYSTQKIYATGTSPLSVVVGDINHDGLPDIVVSNAGDNTIGVLINQTSAGSSTSTFLPLQNFATSSDPYAIAVADINGDGKLDVLVTDSASATSGVSVLINATSPNSSTVNFLAANFFPTRQNPESIATGDFNGDGRVDVAVANYGDNTVSVLLNSTAAGASVANFATQQNFAVGNIPQAIAVGDVNGDGKPDLLVANYLSSSVSVLLNVTSPGAATPAFLAQQAFATDMNPISIALTDLDGDGRIDVVTANLNNGNLSVLLNKTAAGAATPAFSPKLALPTGVNRPLSVAVADINRDGRPDLVSTQDGSSVSVLLSKQYQTTLTKTSAVGTIHFVSFTTPMPFSFDTQSGVSLSSQVISNTVMITGVSGSVPITVSGGAYSIGCNGVFTTSSGSISNGETLCLQLLSSGEFSTSTSMSVNVGTGSASFTVTTAANDTTPAAFSFAPVIDAQLSSLVTSAAATISGINARADVTISGGSYSVNNGPFNALPGTIGNGDQLTVQVLASTQYSTQTQAVVSVGGISVPFKVTTLANQPHANPGGGAMEWQTLLAFSIFLGIRRWRPRVIARNRPEFASRRLKKGKLGL